MRPKRPRSTERFRSWIPGFKRFCFTTNSFTFAASHARTIGHDVAYRHELQRGLRRDRVEVTLADAPAADDRDAEPPAGVAHAVDLAIALRESTTIFASRRTRA